MYADSHLLILQAQPCNILYSPAYSLTGVTEGISYLQLMSEPTPLENREGKKQSWVFARQSCLWAKRQDLRVIREKRTPKLVKHDL